MLTLEYREDISFQVDPVMRKISRLFLSDSPRLVAPLLHLEAVVQPRVWATNAPTHRTSLLHV